MCATRFARVKTSGFASSMERITARSRSPAHCMDGILLTAALVFSFGFSFFITQLFQQGFTACDNLFIGHIKPSRVPRICDVPRSVRKVQQPADFMFRVVSKFPHHIADVKVLHRDQIIIIGVVAAANAARSLGRQTIIRLAARSNSVAGELRPRRRVDTVADLLAACRSGGDESRRRCRGW